MLFSINKRQNPQYLRFQIAVYYTKNNSFVLFFICTLLTVCRFLRLIFYLKNFKSRKINVLGIKHNLWKTRRPQLSRLLYFSPPHTPSQEPVTEERPAGPGQIEFKYTDL